MTTVEGSIERVHGGTVHIKPFDNEYSNQVQSLPSIPFDIDNSDTRRNDTELSIITENNDIKNAFNVDAKYVGSSPVDDIQNQILALSNQLNVIQERDTKNEKQMTYCLRVWRIIITLLVVYLCVITSLNIRTSNNSCNCGNNNDKAIISTTNNPTNNPAKITTLEPSISPVTLPSPATAFPTVSPIIKPSISPSNPPTNIPSLSPSVTQVSTGDATYALGFWNNSPENQRFTWIRQDNLCIVSGLVTHNGTGCSTNIITMGEVPEPCWPTQNVFIDGIYQRVNGSRETVEYQMNTTGYIILNTFDLRCQTNDRFSVQFVYKVPPI